MATYAAKLRSTGVDGQTIRVGTDGRLRGNAGMEPFSAGTSGGAPSTFYVDGNVISSGNGLGWLSAFKTLTEGLAAAHAYMSTDGNRAWAQRATVYCCGDNLTENLVILAERTDIIGVGSSGGYTKCILDGGHVPITTNCWGTRWYNMAFAKTATGILWTLTAPSGGIEFHDCIFSSRGPTHTIGIKATAVGSMKVHDCVFEAAPPDFSTTAIDILAGDAAQTEIMRSYIVGAIGIRVDAGMTATAGQLRIDSNIIRSSGKVIADASNIAVVTRNRGITDVAEATPGDMWDGDAKYWCDNIITGSSGTADQVPYVSEA